MDLSQILVFLAVATPLVMSPGPNGVLIAKTVPTSGQAAGYANVAGFVTAFYVHGALSILGISLLLVQSATAFAIVKYLGAAYLCWIGVRALMQAVRGDESRTSVAPARKRRTLLRAYGEGFLTNALNPKVSMFYLAAFPQFITVGQTSALSAFTLVFLHSMINAVWFGAMVALFARLTKFAGSGRVQRGLKAVTGVVFLAFGAQLAAYRPSF